MEDSKFVPSDAFVRRTATTSKVEIPEGAKKEAKLIFCIELYRLMRNIKFQIR